MYICNFIRIPKLSPGFLARRRLPMLQERRRVEDLTLIQAHWRGILARRNFARMQAAARENAAATRIQAVFRGHRARKRLEEEERRRLEDLERRRLEDEAAVVIQAAQRKHVARQTFLRKRSAAIAIQTAFRGHLARGKANALRRQKIADQERLKQRENAAATKIQAAFRGHRARQALQKEKTAAER